MDKEMRKEITEKLHVLEAESFKPHNLLNCFIRLSLSMKRSLKLSNNFDLHSLMLGKVDQLGNATQNENVC